MYNLLKISLPIFLSCLVAFGLTAFTQGSNDASATATDLVKSFTVSGDAMLEVTTSGGKINVSGRSGNKVTVTAIVKKGQRELDYDSDAWHEALENFELEIGKEGNKVIASAKRLGKSNWSWGKNNVNISFEVDVPTSISSVLKTSGGAIRLSDVEGRHDAKTSGGSIKLENTGGPIIAKTSGGAISVSNQQGDLDLRTSGGSISVDDAKGMIDASTSGGGITLTNTDGDVDVHTSGGRIKIDGTATKVEATTSGGGIYANVGGIRESIYLKTSGGSIHATLDNSLGMDLDLSGNSVEINLENFSGSHKKDKVNGTMNGGGINVYMHTSGGKVECDFR